MFIKDFYNNPAGKGMTVLNLTSAKKDFDKRYSDNIKKIMHFIYKVKNVVYIHIKIPSSVNHIYYDVVVKFTPTSKSTGDTLNDMDIQLFSNSPSFIYTYAHAYFKHKLFIDELRKKLSSKILKTVSEQKNPYKIISYDYSIYFAVKFIIDNGLTDMRYIDDYMTSNKFADMYKNISDWENIQLERSIEKKAMDRAKREERELLKQQASHSDNFNNGKKKNKNSNDVKQVKRVNSAKRIKRVKKI